jgi:type III restriction enzyme
VNNLKTFGRWAFAEFGAVYEIEADFKEVIEKRFAEIVEEKSVKIDV